MPVPSLSSSPPPRSSLSSFYLLRLNVSSIPFKLFLHASKEPVVGGQWPVAALLSLPCFVSHILLPFKTSAPKRLQRAQRHFLVHLRQCTSSSTLYTLYVFFIFLTTYKGWKVFCGAYYFSSCLFFLEGSSFSSCYWALWGGILACWHSGTARFAVSALCWPRDSIDGLAVWWLAREIRGGISSEWPSCAIASCLSDGRNREDSADKLI